MKIDIASSDEKIGECFQVMKTLREDLVESNFIDTIRRLQTHGYKLTYLQASGKVAAVAGFRLSESLAWKRYLYVDDLVTLPEDRSKGYGAALLDWLTRFAEDNQCDSLHLDSGIQREAAHRFYERENLPRVSYHFAKSISPKNSS